MRSPEGRLKASSSREYQIEFRAHALAHWATTRSPKAVVEYAGVNGRENYSAARRTAELEWRRICERRLE